jgi:hypothetical protein
MVEPWRNEFEEGRSLDLGSTFFGVHAINNKAKNNCRSIQSCVLVTLKNF